MGNLLSTNTSCLKQWFILDDGPGINNHILYQVTNNYYMDGWFKERGYLSIKNKITKQDICDFIYNLSELDKFDIYFPNNFKFHILSDTRCYWNDIVSYKIHTKKQFLDLYNKLITLNDEQQNSIYYVISN